MTSYWLRNVYDYYPYGKILRTFSDGTSEKYLTTQHERDAETGLDYRFARFYDSDLGRFLGVDPLAEKYYYLSPYVFVGDNPILNIDPDGKQIIPVASNRERSTNTFIKAVNNQFGEKAGFQIQMAMGGQSSKKEFYKSLKGLDKSQKEMAIKLFNIAGDKENTILFDVIKPTSPKYKNDGITIDRNETGKYIEALPNTNNPYSTGYENSTIPTPFDPSPIDASTVNLGKQGSYSVVESEKNRGLVITTSETNDLSAEQEIEMINQIINTNESIQQQQPK